MPLTEIFSISITTKSATLAFLRSSTGHASDPRRKLREHTLRSLYSWQNLERSMNQSHNLRTVIEIKLLKETSASPWHVTVTRWIKLPTRGNQQRIQLETIQEPGAAFEFNHELSRLFQWRQITSTLGKLRNVAFVVTSLEIQILHEVSVWMEPQFYSLFEWNVENCNKLSFLFDRN